MTECIFFTFLYVFKYSLVASSPKKLLINNKLELTIMSIAVISWLGLFINSIINKYMDN
jgi:hypothetical protein